MHHDDIDPITLEVVCEGLRAIVKEMRATTIRASFSSVIYEFDDFSCALFNPGAEMVAQSDDHPGHVMPIPWSVRCAMEDFEGDIDAGGELFIFPAVPALGILPRQPPEWCHRGSAPCAIPTSATPSNACTATSPARRCRTNASRSMKNYCQIWCTAGWSCGGSAVLDEL